MDNQDLYEKVCKFFEFMMGPLPKREAFKQRIKELVTPDDLTVFFLLPFSGSITLEKLKKRAKMPPEELIRRLDRLAAEAFILSYETPKGPTYERHRVTYMTEQQVRKPEDTPLRTFFAEFFKAFMDGDRVAELSFKTPGFRVLTDESSLTGEKASRTISINVPVPNHTQVLPVDVISDVIKRHRTCIGVAECYCRKAKRVLGEGCEYPLETCMTFGHIAQSLIKTGFARQIDWVEAIDIIRLCEEAGLVHHADNCDENIHTLCNCCPCCCAPLNMRRRGQTNIISPSRYIVLFEVENCNLCENCLSRCPTHARVIHNEKMVVDTDNCIGCGLCVTGCPQSANRMVLREDIPKIFPTRKKLYGKMTREVMLDTAKKKLMGRKKEIEQGLQRR